MNISMQIMLRYYLIPPRDIVDQRILQSVWMGGIPGHTQPKVVASDAAFPYLFLLLIKEPCNLIEQGAHLATYHGK